jgi:HTH-type transcriptional regulator / antitoxin HipB
MCIYDYDAVLMEFCQEIFASSKMMHSMTGTNAFGLICLTTLYGVIDMLLHIDSGATTCDTISEVDIHMPSHIKSNRLSGLPAEMLRDLIAARQARGWSQAELGRRVGLPQVHISGIETGKVAPRFNTLLDLVRVLDYDLLLVPRSLVPAVQSLIRDQRHPDGSATDEGERPMYAAEEPEGGHES